MHTFDHVLFKSTLIIKSLFYAFLLCGVQLNAFSAETFSSRIEISSTFNPVGSGARALGMGGAFISIADDATAASWNPAGLIQIRNPELSAVGGYFNRIEDISFSDIPEANGNQEVNQANLNYLSASYPCAEDVCGKNMVFSINYQNLYNFDKNWDFGFNGKSNIAGNVITSQSIDFEQTGDLYALGFAFAIEVFQGLSVGMTVNYWGDTLFENEWEQTYNTHSQQTLTFGALSTTSINDTMRKENFAFSGVNFNFGLLWEVYQKDEEKLTLGLVFKTPFTASIDRNTASTNITSLNGGPNVINTSSTSQGEELEMPMSFGIGLSYQFSDNFTLAGDVYRTSWDDFIRIDSNGNKFSAISNVAVRGSKVKATYQARLGGEYRIISQKFGENYIIPLRAGIFYDPAPSENGTDDFYGVSLGTGVAFQRYVFDIAYQFRFAHNVSEYILTEEGFSENVYEHTVFASLTVRL